MRPWARESSILGACCYNAPVSLPRHAFALLLAAGTKGKRFALPNSRIMIHQPWGGAQGSASDMERQVAETVRLKKVLHEILARATGKDEDTVARDADRDFFMSAAEAKRYGLVDEVIERAKG